MQSEATTAGEQRGITDWVKLMEDDASADLRRG